MKSPCFIYSELFFLPANFIGRIILLAAIAFAVHGFIHIDSRSHSASDTLINFVFYLFIIASIYSLIALPGKQIQIKNFTLQLKKYPIILLF